MNKKIFSIIASFIGMIAGIIIIVLGSSVQDPATYEIGYPFMRFGADFYTEIYDVTRDAGLASQRGYSYICDAIGWLIICMGIFTICYFLVKLAKSIESSGIQTVAIEEDSINSISASVVPRSPAPLTPITEKTEKTQQPIPVVTTSPSKIETSKADFFMQVSSQIPIIARDEEFIENYKKDTHFLDVLSSISDNSQQLTFLRLTYSYYESDTMTADEYNKKVDNLLGTEDIQRRKQTNQSSAFSNSFEDLIPLLPIHIRGNTSFLNRVRKDEKILKELFLSNIIAYRKELIVLEYNFDHSNMEYGKYMEKKQAIAARYNVTLPSN